MFEKKIIGLCLQNPDKIGIVDENIFIDARDKSIIQLLKKIINEGNTIDLPFVSSYATIRKIELDHNYISECYDMILHESDFESNYRELIRKYQEYEISKLNSLVETSQITFDEYKEQQAEIIGYKYDNETKTVHISDVYSSKSYSQPADLIEGIIPFLDNKDGGIRQELIFIAARPSVGKTAMMKQDILNAVKVNLKVGIFSAEATKESIIQGLTCNHANVNMTRYNMALNKKLQLTNVEVSAISSSMDFLSRKDIHINDTENIDIDILFNEAKNMKRKYDIQILFIDYLQLLKNRYTKLPRHEQIRYLSNRLKELQRKLKIPIVCLAQLNRDADGKEPILRDLKGGGQIEQDGHVIVFLHPEAENLNGDNRLKLIFAKNRNGNTGIDYMIFKKEVGRILPMSNNVF